MDLLYAIIIGIVAGWIAGMLVKGRGFGLLGDLIVGIVGAIVGQFVFSALGIGAASSMGALVMAVVGAVLFLALIKVLKHA